MRKSVLLLIAVILSMASVSAHAGGDETPPDRFRVEWHGSAYVWELKETAPISGSGPVTFVMKYKQVSPHDRSLTPCDTTVPFRIIPHDRLVIDGPTTIPFTWHDTGQMSFTAIIPARDTSGFDFQGPCGVIDSRYFVTTGDTVEIHGSNPRLYPHIPTHTWEHPPQGQRKRGADPQLDSLWGDIGIVEKDTTSQPYIKVEVFHHNEDSLKRAKLEEEVDKREELERSPLVGQQFEYIVVDSQLLMRKEGETKFYPVKKDTTKERSNKPRQTTKSK
jgi:hypothetical protein